MMNSISERESLPVRCRVVCDGISRCASQGSVALSGGPKRVSAVLSPLPFREHRLWPTPSLPSERMNPSSSAPFIANATDPLHARGSPRQHLSVNSPNQGFDCLALDRVRAPVLSIPGYCIVLQPIRVSCQRLSLDPKIILPSIVLTRDLEGKLILQI